MKKFFAVLVAAAMAVTFVPSASAAGYAQLTGVHTEHYATFDRVVFDLTGGQPNVSLESVGSLENCASGKPVNATGVEFLQVRLQPADGNLYRGSRNFTTGLPTAQSIAFTCDYEADLAIAIGVDHHSPAYRAGFLTGPLRYVVDIDQKP
ncbi:AMIN-like domain-containing (lipo)protein [Lentzea sp. NPDC004789]